MDIEKLSNSNKDEWNNFCLNSNDAWFRHTTYWMDYILSCRFDSDSKNHSFLVRQNREIVAIVPLISQYNMINREIQEFRNYDTPTPCYAFKNETDIDKDKIIKIIHAEIGKISNEYRVGKRSFFIDPLIVNNWFNDFKSYNFLRYGYNSKLTTTNILDLTDSEEEAFSRLRSRYKSYIKKELKDIDLRFDYIDSSCRDVYEKLMDFKKIHAIDAGRQTRTDASWECQLKWLSGGYASLVLSWSKSLNKYISGVFILIYKHNAYYGAYATIDSTRNNGFIGHLTQWNAIKYLISKGIKKYETGWNYYKSSFDEHGYNEKLINISKFKRGFGGREIPLIEFSLSSSK